MSDNSTINSNIIQAVELIMKITIKHIAIVLQEC